MLAMNLGDSESPAPATRTRGLTDWSQAVYVVNQRTVAQISKQISLTPHKAKHANFSAAVLSDDESNTSDDDIEVTGIILDEDESSPKSGNSFRSRFSR
jgi:hypothetical protein